MTGIIHANFPAFDAAAEALREAGWVIYSPAEHDRDTGLTGDEIVTRGEGAPLFAWDFRRIIEASCVIFLPGWERSTGSHWEMAVAYATGKPCYEYHAADDLRKIEPPAVVTQPTKCGLRYEATSVGQAPTEPGMPYSDRDMLEMAGVRFVGIPRTPEEIDSEERFREAPTDADVDRWARTEAQDCDLGFEDAMAVDEARTRLNAAAATTAPFPGRAYPEEVRRLQRLVEQPSQPGDWDHPDLDIELVEYGTVVLTTPVLQGETRIVDPETGGAKGQKDCRMGALDPVALEQMGLVAGMGEEKYDRFNFLRGYKWSLSVDAMFRHILAFLKGEDRDPESGLPHMAHAAWHAHALTGFLLRDIGTDDRAPRSK